jgi:hypothetical protein
MNCLTGFIGTVQLKSVFGNINAQYANSSHVDLPSEVKVPQTESSLEDPAGLAARVGMVHYISTLENVLAKYSAIMIDLVIHTAMKKRKYRLLYSPGGGSKPGPNNQDPSWLTTIGHDRPKYLSFGKQAL